MAMDLNAKAAYIRGLMTGMEFDADSKNGKVIAAMMDLLEEMAAQVTEHDDALDQVYDELETLDQDVDDIVSDLYADDDDEDEDDEDDDSTMYEVTCPNCGQISTLDEETLMDPEGDLVCPHCGATFDVELEGTEEDSAEETDKQDQYFYPRITAPAPQPVLAAGRVLFWVCSRYVGADACIRPHSLRQTHRLLRRRGAFHMRPHPPPACLTPPAYTPHRTD